MRGAILLRGSFAEDLTDRLICNGLTVGETGSGFGSNPILDDDRGINTGNLWTWENVGGIGISSDSTYQTVGGEAVGEGWIG